MPTNPTGGTGWEWLELFGIKPDCATALSYVPFAIRRAADVISSVASSSSARPPRSAIPFRDRLNPIRRLDLAFVRLSTTTETIGLHGNHECPVSNVPLAGRLRTTIAFPSFFHFQFIIDIYLSQVSAKSRILYEIFHSST